MKILASQYSILSTDRLSHIAWQIIGTLQGGVLIARMLNKPEMFTTTSQELIFSLDKIT